MSTVRNIDRRLTYRRQHDRSIAMIHPREETTEEPVSAQATVVATRRGEWSSIWIGYMACSGIAVLLFSLVMGLGFSSLNPANPASWAQMGKGVAAGTGLVLLVAVYLGAWLAARSPRISRRNGMKKGMALWGMVLLSVGLITGWAAGNAVNATTGLAGTLGVGLSNQIGSQLEARNSGSLRAALENRGIGLSNSDRSAVSRRLELGDRTGAISELARDANISNDTASDVLDQTSLSPGVNGSGLAAQAAEGLRSSGGDLGWGLFWLSALTLGCALLGGAIGGSTADGSSFAGSVTADLPGGDPRRTFVAVAGKQAGNPEGEPSASRREPATDVPESSARRSSGNPFAWRFWPVEGGRAPARGPFAQPDVHPIRPNPAAAGKVGAEAGPAGGFVDTSKEAGVADNPSGLPRSPTQASESDPTLNPKESNLDASSTLRKRAEEAKSSNRKFVERLRGEGPLTGESEEPNAENK